MQFERSTDCSLLLGSVDSLSSVVVSPWTSNDSAINGICPDDRAGNVAISESVGAESVSLLSVE